MMIWFATVLNTPKKMFVLAVSEGQFLGKHVAFYDLFRIESGKIVEHRDTVEEVPAETEWKNNNGEF